MHDTEVLSEFENKKARSLEFGNSTYKQRIQILKTLESVVYNSRFKIRDAVKDDLGKVQVESDLSETFEVLSEIRMARRNLRNWMSPESVPTPLVLFGNKSFIRYESKGCILIISPWNFPFNLSLIPLVSAIAAGNTVILKPSEFAPASAKLLSEIILTGIPKEIASVIQGDAKVAQHLTSLPFDHIFFTGSTQVGRLVMQAAAKNLTPVTLELGGKSPVIVDETANIKHAAKSIAWGRFFNCGQTCVAPDYLLVDSRVKDTLIQEITKVIKTFYSSEVAESKHYSRLVNRRHLKHLVGLLEDAKQKGVTQIIGGAYDEDQNYFEPTLLIAPHPNTQVMEEEVFGPILPIMSFDKLETALEFVQKKEHPLSLYIFSRNKKNISNIIQNTRSGSVAVNQTVIQFNNPNLPFGGVGKSGMGRYHGHSGFKEFSNAKAILRRSSSFSIERIVYPPYTKISKRIAELLMRWF